MKFVTPVNIPHSSYEISYNDRILLLGSCFSENMFRKLEGAYFRASVNPFGVLYNPFSIARCVENLLSENSFSQLPIINHNGLWHSFLHHGDFSKTDKEEFDTGIKKGIECGKEALKQATVLIITFGTAWVYEWQGQIVGNCHKLPANQFTRRRLTVSEIAECWQKLLSYDELRDKKIIFTISPIRHIKDGLHGNQLSKATLLLAVEELVATQQGQAISYFPSYELMNDELRDYRFYAEDMMHPSSVAIDYIWDSFGKTYFSEYTLMEMKPLQQLFCRRRHRPLHADTEEYKLFKQQTEQKAEMLRKTYPWLPTI